MRYMQYVILVVVFLLCIGFLASCSANKDTKADEIINCACRELGIERNDFTKLEILDTQENIEVYKLTLDKEYLVSVRIENGKVGYVEVEQEFDEDEYFK